MRPKNASPILNRKIKPSIERPMATPFFLKKLNNGLIIVAVNQASNRPKLPETPI